MADEEYIVVFRGRASNNKGRIVHYSYPSKEYFDKELRYLIEPDDDYEILEEGITKERALLLSKKSAGFPRGYISLRPSTNDHLVEDEILRRKNELDE